MKCACILTECARGQATEIACFGKMMLARPLPLSGGYAVVELVDAEPGE